MSVRTLKHLPICGTLGALLALSGPFVAARADTPPLPKVRPVPEDGTLPFGSTKRPGVNAFNLAAHGYVEQEYYLSGKAAVRDETGKTTVPDAPYTTRVLVFKPNSAHKFSGNVIVTPFNWDRDSFREWSMTNRYLVGHGDVFIGISLVKYDIWHFPGANGIKMLQAFDPVRYGPLGVYDDKNQKRSDMPQSQDILAQLGFDLKSGDPAGPLGGWKAKNVIIYSEGVSAAVVESFLTQGRAQQFRAPGGGPLFDAYMVGAYKLLPIPPADTRRDAAFVLVQDERELHRDNAAKLPMLPDTDVPKFRHYDFVGAPHIPMAVGNAKTGELITSNLVPEEPAGAGPKAGAGGPPPPPGGAHGGPPPGMSGVCKSHNVEPVGLVFSALLAGLEAWVDGGPPLPHAPLVELAADGSGEKIDPLTGNAVGGLRPPWIVVPAASFPPGSTVGCGPFEPMLRYDAAKLVSLYGSYSNYARKFDAAKAAFLKAGYLLPDEASELHPTAEPTDFVAH